MSMAIEYTCDLCGREMASSHDMNSYPEGWALSWCGTGSHKPEFGATLEPTRPWRDSPIHICQTCVNAVGKFRDSVKKVGELQVESVK